MNKVPSSKYLVKNSLKKQDNTGTIWELITKSVENLGIE
jgi:hypothetical protein